MFQPWTVTPPSLGSTVNFYLSTSTLLNPLCPSPPYALFISGGVPSPAPVHAPVHFHCAATHDNLTTQASPFSVPASRDPMIPATSFDSFTSLYPPPPPRLPDFQPRSLAAEKISLNVSLSQGVHPNKWTLRRNQFQFSKLTESLHLIDKNTPQKFHKEKKQHMCLVFTSENEILGLLAFFTSKKMILSLVCPYSLPNLYTTSIYTI